MLHLSTNFGGRDIPRIPPDHKHNMGNVHFLSQISFWVHNHGNKDITILQAKVISSPHEHCYRHPLTDIINKTISPHTAKRLVVEFRRYGYAEFTIVLMTADGEEYVFRFCGDLVDY
jgi:hypothetical protein